jgi:hypothetical protein
MGRQVLTVQKHSPALLFAAGVAGVVTTVILASKATLKVEETLEEHEKLKMMVEGVRFGKEYTDADRQRDLALLYTKTAVKLVKLYGPALLIGAASVAALTGSHVVLNRRLAGVTAAYAALEKGFEQYRKRVLDELGPEKDRQFRYGEAIETELSEDTELGTKIQKVKVLGGKNVSIYARFFDETSSSWSKAPYQNQYFVQCQQNYANDKLRARGHMFLNEVYDMLGLERSPEGAVVGWLLDGKDGDGFVDFGVFSGDAYTGQEFVNGSERSVLLDFNVDGVIWDKI